jgi:hypothetical protein
MPSQRSNGEKTKLAMGDEPMMAICRVASCVEPRPKKTATAVASLKLNRMLRDEDVVVVVAVLLLARWMSFGRVKAGCLTSQLEHSGWEMDHFFSSDWL